MDDYLNYLKKKIEMKTTVKTTIKGFENLIVKESVQQIYDALNDKHSCVLVTILGYDGKESKAGIKKTSIKMFKE